MMNEYKKMVEESIHEINKQLSKENNILHDTDFEIFGDNSNFDSITLINFISLSSLILIDSSSVLQHSIHIL